jgi:eukaryotic-like serine/threonine-protein kinase
MSPGGTVLETVGRYKVQEKIGEGAMADVYRAYDPSINRTLAIKVLKNEFLQDEEYAGRFLREAKAAGALSHPNIVTIFDVGEVSGHPFIVMELLDGKPLDKLMSERQKLTLEETMNIGLQLARALDYAHAQGIIHRDIKPSNIMISSDGQSVKILDYGIARLNENDALLGQEVLKTQVGAVLGTPRYMSPEQALGQTSDGRSDLYSVGIVLYELLTGKKAFSSGSMATLMLQITQQDPEPISKLVPEAPGGLTFIINKLLSKKPEKRFQKGAELAAALKRELAAIEALKAEKTKPRSMPLPIKVTLLASLFTLAVLAGSIWAALAKQNKVMQQMAVTSGSAISGFVANNIGTNMLSQDWDQVSVFVKVAAEDKNVEDMVVVDVNNIVRGAKDSALEGKLYNAPSGKVISQANNITVMETHAGTGALLFQFRQPVVYAQGTRGKVYISLRQNAFEAASALSRNVLLGLGLVTLLSVIAVAYTIAALLARPIKRLREAFADASVGNMDFRISHNRKDEFGELFDGFNRMASAVQSRMDTAQGFIGDATSLGSTRTGLTAAAGLGVGTLVLGADAIAASPFGKPASPPVSMPEAMPETMPESLPESLPEPDAEPVDASDPANHAAPDPEYQASGSQPLKDIFSSDSDISDGERSPEVAGDTKADDDSLPDAEELPPARHDNEQHDNQQVAYAHGSAAVADAIAEQSPHSVPENLPENLADDPLFESQLHENNPAPAIDTDTAMPAETDPGEPEIELPETVAADIPVVQQPVPETGAEDAGEDFDRTVIHRAVQDKTVTSMPVNPLLTPRRDDPPAVPADVETADDTDFDRTLIRPPSSG